MAGSVMAGGNFTENILEARSQAGKLQADRVWVQESRSPEAHKLSSAEWLQLFGDVSELARILRWTSILRDREFHAVANASENERSAAINLRERELTNESSLGPSSLLAAKEQTDEIHRQTQPDNHTTLVQDPLQGIYIKCYGGRPQGFRDVSRLALLICSNLVTGFLPKMYDPGARDEDNGRDPGRERRNVAEGPGPIGRIL